MATSESDDFESADEDFESKNENTSNFHGKSGSKINQESDPTSEQRSKADENAVDLSLTESLKSGVKQDQLGISKVETESDESKIKEDKSLSGPDEKYDNLSTNSEPEDCPPKNKDNSNEIEEKDTVESARSEQVTTTVSSEEISSQDTESKISTSRRSGGRKRDQQNKPRESKIGATKLGAKKLGARVAAKVESEEIETETKDSNEMSADSWSEQAIPKDETPTEPPVKISSNKPAEEFASVFDKLALAADKPKRPSLEEKDTSQSTESSGWGWGGWGSSLLSSATASVSTLTSHVSQGINTVIETVEGGLGAPDPEELARQDSEAAKLIAAVKEPTPPEEEEEPSVTYSGTEGGGLFPLGQIFSGVSHLGKMVESTSAKVLSGGLDTLEVIGKKTMEVLQDGDPGLKKKRALFQPDRPILSQVLREAKDHAEEDAKLIEEKQSARKVHFETLFDDFQGLIHLEALEMLSRQCEMKLHASLLSLSGADLQATQTRLHEVRDECLLPDPDDMPDEPRNDIEEALTGMFAALPVDVTADKLIKVWKDVQKNVDKSSDTCSETEDNSQSSAALGLMHQNAISSLAQLTACCVEQFHRTGELLLVHEQRQPQTEAAQLMQITLLESSMIEQLASSLCESLNKFGEPAQPIITKVFLEASNSSTYIQDAFQLLVPVLQVGAV